LLVGACLVLAVVQAALLPLMGWSRDWIIGADGLGIPTDFINVWSAGRLVLSGHAADAYDWTIQKHLQIATLGQDFKGYFAWHYPPPFLAIASALALLPYVAAYIAWPLASFAPFALAMRAIVGRPFGWLLAAGFPVVLSNAIVGQNGFLTAALIGGFLILLPARPVLAGICLGCLSYKPQYGILFPLVLLAAGQWRAIVAATATVLTMGAISVAAFGAASWVAFVHWLPIASKTFLDDGGLFIWSKMQSVYAATRYLGGSDRLAWSLQVAVGLVVAAALVMLWRKRAPYAVKAAGLVTGVLLATPYIFHYDMMVLAIAIGFLVRLGLQSGFHRGELPALAASVCLLLLFPVVFAPIGLIATLIVATLVLKRAGWITARTGLPSPQLCAEVTA
jgi:hypothetical protein